MDFSLFDGHLGGNLNVFNDLTKLLYNHTFPSFYASTILANVGNLFSQGLKIQFNGDFIQGNSFTHNASGQLTFIRTRVKSPSGTHAGYQVSTDHISAGYAEAARLFQ